MGRLGWVDNDIAQLAWDGVLCRYVEQTYADFASGSLVALSSLQPGMLRFSDEISFCWGPDEEGDSEDIEGWMWQPYQSRVWMAYRDSAGVLMMAKSNLEQTGWDEIKPLVYAPSGSHYPSISFDGNGLLTVAIELNPAQGPGGADSEIWIYRNGAVKYLGQGQRPVLIRSARNEMMCFYHTYPYADDNAVICFRSDADGWEVEYTLPTVVGPKRLLSVLPFYQSYSDWPYRKVCLAAIYKHEEEESPRYLIAQLQNEPAIFPEQIQPNWQPQVEWADRKFTVTFVVTDIKTLLPVAGATIDFAGVQQVTNEDGILEITAGVPSGLVMFTVTHPEYMENGWMVSINENTELLVTLIPQPEIVDVIQPFYTASITWEEISLFDSLIQEPVPLGLGLQSIDLVVITIVLEQEAETVTPTFKAASILWTEASV